MCRGVEQVKSRRANGERRRRETARRRKKKGNLVRNGGCGPLISGSPPRQRLTEWGRVLSRHPPLAATARWLRPFPTKPAPNEWIKKNGYFSAGGSMI